MLDIALSPGRNVTKLYNLTAALGAFQPTLPAAPSDWTLSLSYTGGGLNWGQLPAVDAAGNIWVPNAVDPGTLSEFSPSGAPLSPATGYRGGGLSYPEATAVDLTGNVWTANEGSGSVSKFASNGTPLSGSLGFTMSGMLYPYDIAVDGKGSVFTSNGNNTVAKFNSAGAGQSLFVGGGMDVPYAVAIDSSENVWIANGDGPPYTSANSISKFSDSGTPVTMQAYTGGGLNVPFSLAIDANGNVWAGNSYFPLVSELSSTGSPLSGAGYQTPDWVSDIVVDGSNTVWTANADGSISRFANNGTAISPAKGYISPEATGEVGIAIDASGNVWTTDASLNSLFEYVGAAGPTTVPQALAVKNGKLGRRP
jgi:streptogramin lyase